MKAVVFDTPGGPDALHLTEVSFPTPGERQALIRVRACGVCGHDQADRMGLTKVDLPCCLGHEIAGEVADLGPRARGFKVGQRVAVKQFSTCGECVACRSGRELDCPRRRFNYGGAAEYVVVDDSALAGVPDEVDLVSASVVACAIGTSYQAFTQVAALKPGEWVAVLGAGGGLGAHAVQVAAALGGQVLAVTSSRDKASQLEDLGARAVVVEDSASLSSQLMEATGGQGLNVVLDNVGAPELFGETFKALGKRARYVFTGQVSRQRISLYPVFVFSREVTITGSSSTLMSSFMEAMRLVADGKLRAITTTYPLADAQRAHRDLDQRRILGRGVLVP